MNHGSGVLIGPQKIDIFSKRNTTRLRMRWPFFLAVLFSIFVGLFAVWERVQYIRIGHSIQLLSQENDTLLQEKRKLLLEYNTAISLDKVDDEARKRLKMRRPDSDHIFYVK